jgi:lantibiotic biosynthesis protein
MPSTRRPVPPRILPDLLLRAPRLADGETLDDLALELGTPSLAAGLRRGDPGALAARARLERRARFRPTPHALYAGVALGRLGDTTALELGEPVAWLTVAYARLVRLGRALLEDPAIRRDVVLSPCPSLLRSGSRLLWLHGDEPREADVDELLARVLRGPARWATLARSVDEDVLFALIDDGLLVTDLVPPLVGPEPAAWMVKRLGPHGKPLAAALRLLGAQRITDARAALDALPGGGHELHSVLTFPAPVQATLSRTAVERAAALAPRLAALAAALTPPLAERDLDAIAPITALTDQRGAGAFPLAALALGDYGVRVESGPAAHAPDLAVVAALAARIVDAARAGREELALDDLVVPERAPPPTQELFLTPTRDPSGRGWLLALHAPAGATWGRFAHALGRPMLAALRALAAAEPDDRVDVAYAPSDALADLTAHPPIRRAALGLTTAASLTPAELALDADELAVHGYSADGVALVPSPLARLRSTTAPPGVYRQLLAWSLERQHAPWGIVPAPLFALPWIPRLTLGGFVVSPQSWRVEPGDTAATLRARCPRFVQVGAEDELLPVDLDDPDELPAALRGLTEPRVYEIWPPPTELPGSRRVEAVACVVRDVPPREPPPVVATAPDRAWRTLLLHAPPDRHDELLHGVVAPAVADVPGWFFVRYASGERHHLRVRVPTAHAAAVEAALRHAFPALETAPYFPEVGRYGGAAALGAAHQLFHRESRLVLTADEDPLLFLIRLYDATAIGFGLSLAERRGLAQHLRRPELPEWRAVYRQHQRTLAEHLAVPLRHPIGAIAQRIPRHVLPSILHMTANRVLGIDDEGEARAIYLWERTLESLAVRGSRGARGRSSPP